MLSAVSARQSFNHQESSRRIALPSAPRNCSAESLPPLKWKLSKMPIPQGKIGQGGLPLRPAADLRRRQVGAQAACEVSACLFTSDSASAVRVASVFFSSFSVASSNLTASLRPNSAAQVFREP